MKAVARVIVASLLMVSLHVVADQKVAPHEQLVSSYDAGYIARIVPKTKIAAARAVIYKLNGEEYERISGFNLPNTVAPNSAAITRFGVLFTFDNLWYGRGYGNVVAIYKKDGTLIRAYTLDQIFSDTKQFPHSTSSIHWLCWPLVASQIKPGTVYVSTRAGNLAFDEMNGSFEFTSSSSGCEHGV